MMARLLIGVVLIALLPQLAAAQVDFSGEWTVIRSMDNTEKADGSGWNPTACSAR